MLPTTRKVVFALLALSPLALGAAAIPVDAHQLPFIPSTSSSSSAQAEDFTATGSPSLADKLSTIRSASMFYDYIRDSAAVSAIVNAPSSSQYSLFVPTDSAIIALPYKPHRGPPPATSTGSGKVAIMSDSKEDEQARNAYLEKWVQRHIVKGEVKVENGQEYDSLVQGNTMTFAESEEAGSLKVLPGGVAVLDVIEASNGQIVLVDNVLSLD